MTVIARGSKHVADFERALSGRPPRARLLNSRAALNRYLADSLKAERRAREEAARLATPLRDLALGHIARDDPELRKSIEANRRAYEARIKYRIKPPKAEKFEAQVRLGSIDALRTPPYDADFAGPPEASRVEASADKVSGTYHLYKVSSGDGYWSKVSAGVCVYFPAHVDHPQQRVAALINYSDFWFDDAWGYVADNVLRTRIWVWNATTQNWVSQVDVSPQWTSHVNWFDSEDNGDGESGGLSVQAFFPAFANNWYAVWIWSRAGVYSDGGFLGDSDSVVQFEASVPLVIFGSL